MDYFLIRAIETEEAAIEQSDEYKKYAEQHKDIIDLLFNKSGLKTTPSFTDISDVSDPIHCAEAHGFTECIFSGEDEYLNQESTKIHNQQVCYYFHALSLSHFTSECLHTSTIKPPPGSPFCLAVRGECLQPHPRLHD